MFNAIRNHKLIFFASTAVLAFSIALFYIVPQTAHAVTGSDWVAGNIINDTTFYNNSAMTVADIQSFLEGKVGSCDTNGTQPASEYGRSDLTHAQYAASRGWAAPPYYCLTNYYQMPRTDQVINSFNSGVSQSNFINQGALSAAQIIKKASDQYGINPAALIVTLQKESPGPLITDTWPLASQYRNAMGYGCPDTAPCDPTYEGYYNQIMNAARQFKLYKDTPSNYRHKPFQNNDVQYNPNGGCGSSSVYIQNYATAGLYNYTPYQPNTAALNNLYGTGDSCSAYGNRNFWRIFNDWFPQAYSVAYNFPISGSLWLSNLNPSAGEAVAAVYTVKNSTANNLTIDAGLADQNTQSGQWNSYTPQTITLTPGEQRQLTFRKTAQFPGPHRTWIAFYYNGTWYDAKPLVSQMTAYSYTVNNPPEAVTVSSSMWFSNVTPAVGETLTAAYKLKNNTGTPVTLEAGLADQNTQNGQWNSFSPKTVTIAANSEQSISFLKTVKYPGDHRTWIATAVGGNWTDAKPQSNQLVNFAYNVHVPNFRLDYYYFDKLPPLPNQRFNAYLSMTNLESRAINVDALAVPIRNNYTGIWSTMNSSAMNFSIDPGKAKVLGVSQSLAPGNYSIWPSTCVTNYCFTPRTSSGIEMFWVGWI